jgi:peptidyl-tRNA hydrolase, PTH2 family
MRTKQVIVIRKDLNMRRGKEIAQGSHASMAFITKNLRFNSNEKHFASICFKNSELEWLESSFRKITCSVDSLEELQKLHELAKAAGIESNIITDSGFTEFNGVPTITCLAIGPDYDDKIDPITSELKLY